MGGVFLIVLSWKLTLVALAILPVIALMMLAQSTVLQSYSKRSVEALERVEVLALPLETCCRFEGSGLGPGLGLKV